MIHSWAQRSTCNRQAMRTDINMVYFPVFEHKTLDLTRINFQVLRREICVAVLVAWNARQRLREEMGVLTQ